MSTQLPSQVTIPATAAIPRTSDERSIVVAHPAFCAVRRAIVRLQAAHTTRAILRELVAIPQPVAGRKALFVRLDVLSERYAALGGDPADLRR